MSGSDAPCIGVVVVTYCAETFIAACLESLVGSCWPRLRIVVVDNRSPDRTVEAVRGWATGGHPFQHPEDWPLEPAQVTAKPRDFVERDDLVEPIPDWDGTGGAGPGRSAEITLIRSGGNLGFAGGVNLGLRLLRAQGEATLFWVLNPDSVVAPDAPTAFAKHAAKEDGRFAIISCRVTYYEAPNQIQADAGRFRYWVGFGASVHHGCDATLCPPPDMEKIDYVPGMSMLVSAAFLDRAGPMEEGWFLYFEEIDWALRRGDLPILFEPTARVIHRSGASIGTGSGMRIASALSVYFMHRNMVRFMWRWSAWRLPVAVFVTLGLLGRDYLWRHGLAWDQIVAGLRGLAQFGPPESVRRRLSAEDWRRILG